MTVMATLAPAVERLFERIDVEARDETLRDLHAHWRKKRGKSACPSLAALQLPRLGDAVRAAFAFQRVTPSRPDWRLSFCGADAEAWIRPGGSSLLSKLPDRRSAVRLRHLVSMAVKHGELIVVQYEQRRAGDQKHVEVLVLPLASDGVHPDGVFCAVRCTPAASTAVQPTLGSPDGDGLSRPPRRIAAAKVHDVSVRGAVSAPVAPLASDIMSMDLEVVRPDTPVPEIASRMLSRGISAVPVVDDDGRLVGIVSEADLVARAGEEPDARPSWWSLILKSDADLAAHFVRTHGMKARDVMTTAVVTVGRDTPLTELVTRMGRKRIRRVVVTDGDIPIGLVSRSDVLRAQAAHFDEERGSVEPPDEDTRLRDELLANLQAQPWFHLADRNVVVIDGVACFWGIVPSEAERDALRVAAAEIPGIRGVEMKVELGQIYPTV